MEIEEEVERKSKELEKLEVELVENAGMFMSRGRLLRLVNGEMVYGVAGGTGECRLYDYNTGEILVSITDHL